MFLNQVIIRGWKKTGSSVCVCVCENGSQYSGVLFKPGPKYHLWHWHNFLLFSHHPASVNVQTWKNHYSYKKVVYLPDGRWLITVEAVSIATSSLAAKGKWDFHPISFEMALVFSERGELDLLEREFCFEIPNSVNPGATFNNLFIKQRRWRQRKRDLKLKQIRITKVELGVGHVLCHPFYSFSHF